MNNVAIIVIIYYFILTVIGFTMMGIDKRRAKKNVWRTSEKSLLMIALLGGVIGTIVGGRTFRHKTKKRLFRFGLPVIFILHVAVWIMLVNQ
ncbi:DUF1294 domain-containing protein [Evansella halocellulosilytica]|uniref:DUF1294 domain-containing protein n=1 Tax=Evansella halocellulosilytica TaxID=2011013 RepID=UPI000BB6E345|nr:DUF1294 domain-containing protein [Evansella halocellulosilytica]